MRNTVFITTTIEPDQGLVDQALGLAQQLNTTYIPRAKLSLAKLFNSTEMDKCFVLGKHKLSLYIDNKEYFFHPNMAKLRIFRLKQGEGDYLLKACCLKEGMTFLDGTLGMAADSIVAAYAIGTNGKVVGVETNPLIAALVRHGLDSYEDVDPDVNRAMRLVEVVSADHLDYLRQQPDHSIDVIYFDPMFKHSITGSVGIDLLREVGHKHALTQATLLEARRVAKQRLVIKGRSSGEDFLGLDLDEIVGGKYSSVAYGVIFV